MDVAIVHDYLTQRGGAERVVLAMADAFPGAPVYTSLYQAATTFPEFKDVDVRTGPLNRIPAFRHDHRLALPLLAPSFSTIRVDADVVLCSSSGWAHGARVRGRKLVYCHAPARWLYQTERYLGSSRGTARAILASLAPTLRRWDRRAARTADRYLANSSATKQRIREVYGIDASVLHPAAGLDPDGPKQALGLAPGYLLCVSRLLPYKNVDVLVAAVRALDDTHLVVVGEGPERERLQHLAGGNVTFVPRANDSELRWLYENAEALVSASHEDLGLTPVEAAGAGRPGVVLRAGGFLDTVVEDVTGVFFDRPAPADVVEAVRRLRTIAWDPEVIRTHAAKFSLDVFIGRLRDIVAEMSR